MAVRCTRWLLQATTLHLKLRPNSCRWRRGYYYVYIGTRHRPVQRYHRRRPTPPTTYRLTTIPHDWHSRVRNDFKFIHGQWFSCHVKGLYDLLLVTNSNFGPIYQFPRYDQLSVVKRASPLPSVQLQIWKCSLCTPSPKFCMPMFMTQS